MNCVAQTGTESKKGWSMMTKSEKSTKQSEIGNAGSVPCLNIAKLGVVSRDYGHEYENGFRDFSYVLPNVLKLLDGERCDAVLFSLFSIIPRKKYDLHAVFKKLRSIKTVLLEEFEDGEKREVKHYVIYHRTNGKWSEYKLSQVFGRLGNMNQKKMDNFVTYEMPKRIVGNCCVLLCGETNGVKLSREPNRVEDTFGLRASIPKKANIILNPIHDRMFRPEMLRKRKFLSEDGRWIVSVWNKGKKDKNGTVRDGSGPAWTVFHNGQKEDVKRRQNGLGVEIGILDMERA